MIPISSLTASWSPTIKQTTLFSAIGGELACATSAPPERFAGAHGTSDHGVAVDLAKRILQAAAESLGTIFVGGVDPETKRPESKILGWHEGFQQCKVNSETGEAVAETADRVRISLRATDFRQRLQAMPDFDADELIARIARESAIAMGRRGKEPVSEDSPLSDTQRHAIIAMLELKATDPNKRASAAEIVERAEERPRMSTPLRSL